MPKLLADTLRMLALLGRIPSCVRRRARPGAGVYALARARHRVSARGHACICTRSHTDARLAKRGCSQQNKYALSEYEGRVRNRYRFLTPKAGPFFGAFFYLRCVVSLVHVLEILCRIKNFQLCTVRVRGSAPKSVPPGDTKNGPVFLMVGVRLSFNVAVSYGLVKA